MIRKIHAWEYQKRYDNMSAIERSAYESRVGEWLRDSAPMLMNKIDGFDARLQNVVTVSTGWNIRECQAFEEGVLLLSSLVSGGETWLPDMLYTKTARRSIKRMCGLLTEVMKESTEGGAAITSQHRGLGDGGAPLKAGATDKRGGEARLEAGTTDERGGEARLEAGATDEKQEGVKQPFRGQRVGNRKGEGAKEQASVGSLFSGEQMGANALAVAGVPVRPRHIDQYVHLLPKKTQDRAANYGSLMRELDSARERLRLLAGSPQASPSDREAWAKKVSKLDREVGGIKKELDAEWEKLVKSGRVVVDDLGMARVVPSADVLPAMEDDEKRSLQDKVRRRELRKWLVDTRHGNSSEDAVKEHAAKWCERFKEYLSLEGEKAFKDSSVLKGAAHYGVDLSTLGGGKVSCNEDK